MKQLFFFCIAIVFSSCVSHNKITYFNDLEGAESGQLAMPEPPSPKIEPNDILEINISSTSSGANQYFEKGEGENNDKSGKNRYQVSPEGNIDVHLLGAVNIVGKTITEAEKILREKLLTYLKNPTVSMRLANFQITVLGEVENPGVFNIPSGRATVLEALGYAGDLTVYGKRSNIMLIRTSGGEKKFFRIDLNQSAMLNNNQFYLRNHDVLYVEPSKGKTSQDDNAYRILPLALSALTFVVVVIGLTQ